MKNIAFISLKSINILIHFYTFEPEFGSVTLST